MTNILVNGEAVDTISVNDRGLHYGDGLFETMAVRNGKVCFWDDHWFRLVLGCKKLSINLPDKEKLEKDISLICNSKSESQFVIKLIVTRGVGQRGYSFKGEQRVTCILNAYSWPDYPERFKNEGVAVRYCETTLSENIKLAEIKHLNRLEQVLARNEWDTDDFQEGLMLTQKGNVVDGTMSNVFAVKDRRIFTPSLSMCGVSGIMRKQVIKIAKEQCLEIYEKDFSKVELEMADELFLTNSLFGIWPIRLIAKTRYTKVGSVTKMLQDEVHKLGHR